MEERINVVDVATEIKDDGAGDSPGYDVGIMEEDEIEVQFVQKRDLFLVGYHPTEKGR